MASVNKVILVGNLGADPEIRYLPSGESVANIRLATTDRYKDRQTGEMREMTEWHRVSFFGKLAEIAGQYLRKGSQVYVEGSIRTRKYTDKDGLEKYATDIRGDAMQMLGSRQGMGAPGMDDDGAGHAPRAAAPAMARPAAAAPGTRPAPQRAPAPAPSSGFDDMDDDIPF